jgi:PAS domain S-box-containing protein
MPSEVLHLFPTLKKIRLWLTEHGGLSVRHLWIVGLGVTAIVIVAGILLNIAWRGQVLEANRTRAYQALRLAQSAERNFLGMESTHRDFLRSREASDSARFQKLRAESRRDLIDLVSAFRYLPAQREKVRQIATQLEDWLTNSALPAQTAAQQDRTAPARTPRSPLAESIENALEALVGSCSETCTALEREAWVNRQLQTGGLGLLGALSVTFLVILSVSSYKGFLAQLRKTESALAQTNAILATTQDGVVVVDNEGLIRSINPAAEQMFAQSAAGVLGKSISVLIPQRLFVQDMANMGRGSIMAVGHRSGYHQFPIEISLSEITVNGARQFCALIRDVTERKRSEETLKQIGLGVSSATGEEFVRSLLKQLSKALNQDRAFLVELTGPVGTPTALLTIAERGELRPTVSFDLEHSACLTVVTGGFRAYAEGARASFPEDSLLAECEVEAFVGMPLNDHRGERIGVMGVLDRQAIREVQMIESTLQIFSARAAAEIERKRYEGALAAEKERLTVTLRSIADGCISLDNDGNVLMLNPVAERLTGWSQKNAVGKELGEILHLLDERTRKRCQHALSRIVATGNAESLGSKAILMHRDGTERFVESNSSPIRDHAGRKVGVVIVLRDITERQRMEEERQKAEKLESLGVVAGGIAHDFNNLFTAILGNLSLVLSASPDPVAAERLGIARKSTQRAQELAGQLLTFARGGAPVKQTTSLADLLRHTIACAITGPRVVSDFNIDDDLWPVEADTMQISQVISNLAVNAEQAMSAGGRVEVIAGNLDLPTGSTSFGLPPGRWVFFSIRDEGVGIPEQYLTKIFDPYFTTKSKGTGLGLATAYSIVKNHGGNIQVDSTPGAGSTFTIYLPASDKPLQSAAPEAPVPKGSGRVLVLDDEEVICMLVTCALEPLGYEVTETNDPLTAIARYEESMRDGKKFDLVISDLTMPGTMGGQEAIKHLRKLDPAVRAIVSSGYASDPVMSRYEDFGFCGMIAKPYEIDALGRKVAEVMAQTTRPQVIYPDAEERLTA